jgi:hypothetical protein
VNDKKAIEPAMKKYEWVARKVRHSADDERLKAADFCLKTCGEGNAGWRGTLCRFTFHILYSENRKI